MCVTCMMLWKAIFLTTFFKESFSIVTMTSQEFQFLQEHKMNVREHLSNNDLNTIVYEEWYRLHSYCPSISDDPSIQIYFDGSLTGGTVLAWASQTLILDEDLLWKTSLIKPYYSGYDITIGVNPDIPNGWHSSLSCDDIGYRYDLRTVLRHELVHGMSMASSLYHDGTSWSLGHVTSGICYPRFYDTKITDSTGQPIVQGCALNSDVLGADLYLGGVKLYNPNIFQAGSSISHHNYPGHLMYKSLSSRTCIDLGDYEMQMLGALEIPCNSTIDSSGTYAVRCEVFSFLPSLALALLLVFLS